MKNEWDDFAEVWDSVAGEYAEKAFAELVKIADLANLRVFDFGCGTGLLTERMAPVSRGVVALDNSQKMTAVLQKKDLKDVTVISTVLTTELISKEPVFQTKFDLVVASSVCGFLPNYKETLELLFSLLNPNGLFVQWDWLKNDIESQTGFTKRGVEEALKASGFENVSVTVPFEMINSDGKMPVLMAVGNR